MILLASGTYTGVIGSLMMLYIPGIIGSLMLYIPGIMGSLMQ